MDRKSQVGSLDFLREEVEQTRALYESAKAECERVRTADLDPARRVEAAGRAALIMEFLQQAYRRALSLYKDRLLRNGSSKEPGRRTRLPVRSTMLRLD
jgi:hypothetical protein